jgi:tetratricopeptide (TPR) repeat protein
MPGKVIPLMLLTLLALAAADGVFEQKETYDLSKQMSTLLSLWAGDIDGDRTAEILAGGIVYEGAISKGILVQIKRNDISVLAKIPSTSRTVAVTVCDATADTGQEIVVGANDLYICTKAGKILATKPVGGDVTAVQAIDTEDSPLNEILCGTSSGEVLYLVNLEIKQQVSVMKSVTQILKRDNGTFYVIAGQSIHCMSTGGEKLWLHNAQGEVTSAAVYDTNNDAVNELIYIAGPSIYTLSSDGKKETLLMTPSNHPLSLLVRDFTDDGKPDLVVADSKDSVAIYSNLKQQVDSLFFRREAGEIPLLFAANVVGDQKIDLIYGGVTKIQVLENIIPSAELVTRGQQVLSEGKGLLAEREYERAESKFEEAERIFSLGGEEKLAAECQAYIDQITELLKRKSEAENAIKEGKDLFSQEKYEQAKIQFELAAQEYGLLAQQDSFYQSNAEEARTLMNQCDEAIADQYFDAGMESLSNKQYDEAKGYFEAAEAIYSQIGSEKAELCLEKIQQIQSEQEEKPIEKDMTVFLYAGGVLLLAAVVAVVFATRKNVSTKLEKGRLYLLLEAQSKKGLQLIREYGRIGYEGLVISRLPPEQLRKKKLKKQKILQFSSTSKEDSIPPDNVVNILLGMKEFMTSRDSSIILLDSLDYLIIQNSFEDAFSFIQKLAESVTLYKGIVLVELNPKSLEERELVLLEGEMELLEM